MNFITEKNDLSALGTDQHSNRKQQMMYMYLNQKQDSKTNK